MIENLKSLLESETGPSQACGVWGFLTMWPERGGFDGLVGPTFLGGGTSKSELQAQERDRRESRHAAPVSGGFGAQGEPGPSLPGVRCSSRGRSLASSRSPGNDLGVRSAEKSGPETVGGCSVPGVLGAEPGAAHSSPGVAAQESEGWAAPAPIAGSRSWWGLP